MEKKSYKFVVLSNPVAGQEDEYNEWYNDVHLGDVLKVKDIIGAQRFTLSDTQVPDFATPWKYMAIYEIETDDVAAVIADLKSRSGTALMQMSDAINREDIQPAIFATIG